MSPKRRTILQWTSIHQEKEWQMNLLLYTQMTSLFIILKRLVSEVSVIIKDNSIVFVEMRSRIYCNPLVYVPLILELILAIQLKRRLHHI
jgi:hypothetical protein